MYKKSLARDEPLLLLLLGIDVVGTDDTIHPCQSGFFFGRDESSAGQDILIGDKGGRTSPYRNSPVSIGR